MNYIITCAINAVLETEKGNEIEAACYLQNGGPIAVTMYLNILRIKEKYNEKQ